MTPGVRGSLSIGQCGVADLPIQSDRHFRQKQCAPLLQQTGSCSRHWHIGHSRCEGGGVTQLSPLEDTKRSMAASSKAMATEVTAR